MTDAGAVTRPGSLFGWDPFRPFVGLANTGVFAAHLTAFITLRQLVLGRRLAVRLDTGELVLTLVEFIRRLLERQAIRRMEQKTLTRKEVEAVGEALMRLEETVREMGKKFGLTADDLNLDLGPLGKLM